MEDVIESTRAAEDALKRSADDARAENERERVKRYAKAQLEAEARMRHNVEKKKKLVATYDALVEKEAQGSITEEERTALAFMEGLMQ